MEDPSKPLIGVLALQGAFEEHQACLEAVGCRTAQVRTSFSPFRLFAVASDSFCCV